MILIETNDATIRIDADNINVDAPHGAVKQEAAQTPTLVKSRESGGSSVFKTIRRMVQSQADLPGEHSFASLEPLFRGLSQNATLAVRAKDVMQEEVVWAEPDDSVERVLTKMQQTDSGYLLVGTDRLIAGIVSKSDLAGAVSPYLRPEFAKWRRPLDDASLNIKIKWIMSRPVRTIRPETPLAVIMENMCRFGGCCLPVLDRQGKVYGLVTVFDVFKALENADTAADEQPQHEAKPKQSQQRLEPQSDELTAANEQLQQEIAESKQPEEGPQQYRDQPERRTEEQAADLAAANEKLQQEIAERKQAEERIRQRSDELTDANEQLLQQEITERKQAEERLGQRADELTAAYERLQQEIAECKQPQERPQQYRDQLEHRIEEQAAKLAAANEKLQQEIVQRRQVEEHFKRRADELTVANELLQQQVSEREQTENELQQYRNGLEQRLQEQTAELAAVNKKLQQEIALRRQAEKALRKIKLRLLTLTQGRSVASIGCARSRLVLSSDQMAPMPVPTPS